MRRIKGLLNETFTTSRHQSSDRIPPLVPSGTTSATRVNVSQLDVEEAETATFHSIVANSNNNNSSSNSNNNRQQRRRSTADFAYQTLQYGLDFSDNEDDQQHFRGEKSYPKRSSSMNRLRQAVKKVQSMEKSRNQQSYKRNEENRLQMNVDDDDNTSMLDDMERIDDLDGTHNESIPLLVGEGNAKDSQHEYGAIAEAYSYAQKKRNRPFLRLNQSFSVSCVMNSIRFALLHSIFVWTGVPATILAWVLFYILGDPELDFLPGQISLSWWMNFICRLTITLDAARCLQYLFLETIMTNNSIKTTILGPGITQFCMKSKGWPAVATIWSLLNMIVLHGNDNFVKQWFYWTGLRIFSLDVSVNGNSLIGSNLYLRFLLAMMVAGLATSVKRFLLDFQFKQRQCLAFKSRLEKILIEMILVSDIAFLGDHASIIQNMSQTDIVEDKLEQKTPPLTKSKASERISFDISTLDESVMDDVDHTNEGLSPYRVLKMPLRGQTLSLSSSSLLIKNLLDPWEPPDNKNDKSNVSVRDVLRFQSALSYIHADDPFGESFGPACDRDSCIASAIELYDKLLLLNSSGSQVLDFDVLILAICDQQGIADPVKKKAMIRLFRPDAKHQVTQLAFVQSCDAVYKRLQYFQASVGNASVIDNVLASIVDTFFYFVLTLMLLSLLEFNPWTLLVSITSLLVSISFALGPSVSKYVEGVLLIAVRRPFDLGDRIYIGPPDTTTTAAPGANVDMSNCTWFVEDINLSTTTLRFARTNEVSTMNNWAIAGSKIINCNRSPGALIVLNVTLHVSIFQNNKLDLFQAELQQYVVTHPRIWDSLVFCRHDSIDADLEQVVFQLSFRHRNSWQDAGRIKLHRADLIRFIYELSLKLKVQFETPPPRRLLYHGGSLAQGQVIDFKRNLLIADNILNYNGGHAMDDISMLKSRPSNVSRDYSSNEPLLPGD